MSVDFDVSTVAEPDCTKRNIWRPETHHSFDKLLSVKQQLEETSAKRNSKWLIETLGWYISDYCECELGECDPQKAISAYIKNSKAYSQRGAVISLIDEMIEHYAAEKERDEDGFGAVIASITTKEPSQDIAFNLPAILMYASPEMSFAGLGSLANGLTHFDFGGGACHPLLWSMGALNSDKHGNPSNWPKDHWERVICSTWFDLHSKYLAICDWLLDEIPREKFIAMGLPKGIWLPPRNGGPANYSLRWLPAEKK